MRNRRKKQSFRIYLLALILALALTWYSLNPAPGAAAAPGRRKLNQEEEGGQKREVEPEFGRQPPAPGPLGLQTRKAPFILPPSVEGPDDDDDDFDWPEYIDG